MLPESLACRLVHAWVIFAGVTRWCALKVRVDCPECGTPILIDGPYRRALCEGCRAHVSVANLWRGLVERALEDGSGGRHFRGKSFIWAGNVVPQIIYAANRDHPPLCSACDEPIPAADDVPDGTDGQFYCPACGAAHPTWPAPGYLTSARVTQVFMAPPEDEQGRAIAAAAPSDARPIMFSCVNCGGALKISADSPRVVPCEYCEVDNHLPAELWNRLHPVRRRRAFWLRTQPKARKGGGR
jgi:predicted RNA-binding Zn-ribbon protein involved in translation (DUF1610 family)